MMILSQAWLTNPIPLHLFHSPAYPTVQIKPLLPRSYKPNEHAIRLSTTSWAASAPAKVEV
jgi:hypothetical protein